MSVTVSSGLSPVRRVLPGGGVALVQETAFTPAATISVSFRAGTLYEPAALPGLSAFLARVIDRGTATRSADDIAEALDDRGVTLRVSTNRHLVTLSCTCLSEDVRAMLDLIADICRAPSFPAEEVEKRRAEVITALRQDEDNPGVRASDALLEMLYGASHPYGRPPKGSFASVERISRDDLLALHRARFGPDAMMVVIVGDVDTESTLAQVASAFAGWDAPVQPEVVVPPVCETPRRRLVRINMPDKAQTDIAYGFVSITRLDPTYHAHWVMNNILGQFGLGGRLAENIRERQGLAYYAFSAFDPSLGPGPLVVRAGVAPENVERALDAIDAEVGALGAEGPTERELEETRQFLIGSIPRMLDTNASIASFLQTSEFFERGLDYDRKLPSILARVTLDEVRAAAKSVLDPGRAAVAIAGPAESA